MNAPTSAPSPSPIVELVPRHGTRTIAAIAAGRADVVNLTFGEPDFDTPRHIAEAGCNAIRAGHTRYAPGAGIPQLREAAAAAVGRRTATPIGHDQVVVTAGAILGVYGTLAALVARGGGVLVPDPGWPSYVGQCRVLGHEPIAYRLDPANDFEPDLDALERLAVRPGVQMLVINNPGNPTGAVWRRETVEACVELARRHGLWLLADEVYDEFTFDRPHVSTVPLNEDGRIVSVFSCSKTYAMTGWRVGYLTASRETAATILRVLEHCASSVGTPAQHAALTALTGPQDCVAEMREAYRARRDAAVRLLREEDLLATTPQGAFYAMADVSRSGADSWAFATALAEQRDGAAVVPGDSFGPTGSGMVRLSLASSMEAIEQGIRRVGAAVRADGRR
ncbi:MAG: aminotransferase class I/II-fold pyridoxal phosphate-dependent enzyme [Actinobacteria bacterium]|nr:aminotransferase class I/II-fold pyridoxal phosphate-dependent enzyme [Actinomycetota bacterium]